MRLADVLSPAPIGIAWEELEALELFSVESPDGVTAGVLAAFRPPLPAKPLALVALEGRRQAQFFGRVVFVWDAATHLLTAYELET